MQEILKLDDPDIVEKHLPEWTSAKLVDGSAQTSRITLRMLLSHTAGFGYTFFNPELKAWEKQLGDDEFGEPGETFAEIIGADLFSISRWARRVLPVPSPLPAWH